MTQALRSSVPADAQPRSGRNAALVLGQRACKPLARLGRINECVKKCFAVTIGQQKALVLGDRPARGLGERCHAKVADFAPRQTRRLLNEALCLLIQPEVEALGAGRPAAFG